MKFAEMLRTVSIASWLLLGGCTPYAAQAPKGFATFEEGDDFRAANHDGVLYRVRTEDNEPHAELAFWKEALKERMDAAGYVLLGDETLKAQQKPGYLLKLAAPVGTVDYAYWVAIFVHDDNIVLAEATGPATVFKKHEDTIRTAISKLQFQ